MHIDRRKYIFVDNQSFFKRLYELLMEGRHASFQLFQKYFTPRESKLLDFHYAKDADQRHSSLKIESRYLSWES